MKIGLAQYKFINNDVEFNLSQIEKAMRAYGGKVDLLCFGEAFLQGFDSLSWNYEKDKEIAVSRDSEEIKKICCWSKEYNVAILFGYIEKEDDSLYSSCAFIKGGGVEENYRRISRGWKDYSRTDYHYKEGEETVSFSFKSQDFLIACCGDLWDADWERFKTDATVLWPVYVNFDLDEWTEEEQEYARQASSISSRVLIVNSLSCEPDPISHGGTFDIKKGRIIGKLPYDEEGVLVVELPEVYGGRIARIRLQFYGRVQRVGFRNTANRAANSLGISGWVRNEGDGSVTLEAQGSEEAISRMIEIIREGRRIRIDDIVATELDVVENEQGFSIKRG